MRRALLALAVFAGVGCQPAAEGEGYAVVMAVGSLDPVVSVETWVRNVDLASGRTWRDEPFAVPRSNIVPSGPTFEALLVRVNLEEPGNWVIRLVGRGPAGVLESTGCYEVDGVVEDDFVLLARIEGNDADFDDSPDDADEYCRMLQSEGAPCPTGEDVGYCPPMFAFDCEPDEPGIYPLADDLCENGIDEDCSGADAICGGDCDPPCRGAEICVEGSCVCEGEVCRGLCVDTRNDRDNCGGCDVSCTRSGRTDSCSNGQCSCGEGEACGSASACIGGECVCDGNRGDCDDDRSNGCETDLLFDSDHCGSCEITCKRSCLDGDCQ